MSSQAVGQCTICLETMKLQDISSISKCGHTFHCECITQWFETSTSCPMCRVAAKSTDLIKLFIAEAVNVQDNVDITLVTSTSSTPISTVTKTTRTKKIPVRCRFWPHCINQTCLFVHPCKACITFATNQCFRGDQCHFIHPQCIKGKHCSDVNCNYSHILIKISKPKEVNAHLREDVDPPAYDPLRQQLPDISRLRLNSSDRRQNNTTSIRCRFDKLCRNDKCKFIHSNKCTYDINCNQSTCPLWHPNRNANRARV